MFDRNQTCLHLFLVPINSSPSATAGKRSNQLGYTVVFIPTLNLGSGLACRVDHQVSRLSPQCEFWPGWDIVDGFVVNVIIPKHCFGAILGSSQCLPPALDHPEIFPWRLSQTVTQYQMWVDLLYMWPIKTLLTYILPPKSQPSSFTTKEPSVQQERPRLFTWFVLCLKYVFYRSFSRTHNPALYRSPTTRSKIRR